MDLEQRVEALEQEVEILKNQIQTTLLNIEDYLLTTKYSSLRAEDIAPQDTPGAAPVHRPVAAAAVDDESPTAPADGPVVRQVASYQPEVADPKASTVPSASMVATEANDAMGWQNMADMRQWVDEQITQHGPARTERLINALVAQERIKPKVATYLLRLVALRAADAAKAAAQRPSNRRQQTADPRPASGRRPGRPSNGATATPPAAVRQPTTADTGSSDPEDEQTNLVLRLVAGVLNAGVNGKRSNQHG